MTKKIGDAAIALCYLAALAAALYGAYTTLASREMGDSMDSPNGIAIVLGAAVAIGLLWFSHDSLTKIRRFSEVRHKFKASAHAFVCPTCGRQTHFVTEHHVRPTCSHCGTRIAA